MFSGILPDTCVCLSFDGAVDLERGVMLCPAGLMRSDLVGKDCLRHGVNSPREWLFRHFGFSSVTLSHYEVERAQNSWNVRDHVVNEEVGKNREVYEGRSSDFQPVRDPSSLGINVES